MSSTCFHILIASALFETIDWYSCVMTVKKPIQIDQRSSKETKMTRPLKGPLHSVAIILESS